MKPSPYHCAVVISCVVNDKYRWFAIIVLNSHVQLLPAKRWEGYHHASSNDEYGFLLVWVIDYHGIYTLTFN